MAHLTESNTIFFMDQPSVVLDYSVVIYFLSYGVTINNNKALHKGSISDARASHRHRLSMWG